MNFYESVYEALKSVPKGKVISYGALARLAGRKGCARQVGWALHSNPQPVVIPCHRVVFKDGSLAKGFAFGGEGVQRKLLEAEGVTFVGGKVDMKKHEIDF